MVGPAGNPPRHQLTEHERRLCLEALLSDRHERRVRRAQQKTGDGVGVTARAAKRTSAAMEVAEAKGDAYARPRTEGKEDASATAAAEAKQTTKAKDAAAEAKETATKKTVAIASRKKMAAAKAVAKPPATSKKKAHSQACGTGKKRAAARPPASRMKKKAAKETSGESSSTKKKAAKEVGDSPAVTVGREADHAVKAAVGEVLDNIVGFFAVTENPTTPVRTPLPAEHTAPTSKAGKRNLGPSPASRKRRRGILQDDEVRYVGVIQHKNLQFERM
ncbi:hypothetical protein PF003_g36283 [Phytophthora fragariae]|nr:hypothetical protein PF003_g36283 [Phytophthora fragariae]